jgi:hypothetical protein
MTFTVQLEGKIQGPQKLKIDLTMEPRLASLSSCPSAGITDMHHHTMPDNAFSLSFFFFKIN